ncbi:HSPB1-associated protein 1 [Strongylocentrotus purpuratus]|uniref:JmjC domain-containing protein n=1 Tax=Strongylocentrotus purpuratus TaxID=7668 RepID=A0A7M7T5Q7_STRPU|nr:HSPB1-associated protein 1 [Strongylocentrotus purpuratus]
MAASTKRRGLTEPTVIKDITKSWPCFRWDVEDLSELLGDDKIRFRLGRKNVEGSGFEFEGDCIYEEATMKDFCKWCRQNSTEADDLPQTISCMSPSIESDSDCIDDPKVHGLKHSEESAHPTSEGSSNPLMFYDRSRYWCYADYKHMKQLFKNCPSVLEDVRWRDLGFDRDGGQSTIWIGSEGANTPCHQDTYGFNLVAQIRGRKKWHLFPPSQTELMYPTRIPYEESSVFSQVNVRSPDLQHHPKFGRATPYVAVLHPGDILFVPKSWWHFVESLDTSISINCWMDLESDHVSRVDEAIARTLVCGLMSLEGHEADDQESVARWLNPTEEATSASTNLALLGDAVDAAFTHYSKTSHEMEENMPEALINLKEGDPSLRHCQASKRNTLKEQFQRNVDSDEKNGGDASVNMGEKASHVEAMNLGNTKGMSSYQQTSHSYYPSTLSTPPITTDPIDDGRSTQGLLVDSDSTCVKPGGGQSGMEGKDRGQNQSNSVKRIKLCDNVTIPGSGMMVARQSVFPVPCHGSVTQLTASRRANDCANLKIEQETGVPSSATLETSDSFVDVTMATLVECLTQPNIIALLREGLLEKVRDKQQTRTPDD